MKLKQLADHLGLAVAGDPDVDITRIAEVHNATSGSLAFVVATRYADALRECKASAVILPEDMTDLAPCSYLISPDPYLSYAQASQIVHADAPPKIGISPSASVSPQADIDPTAEIGECVVVGAGARIGAGCVVGAGSCIEQDVVLGENCRLFANVTVGQGTKIGRDCRIQSGAVIGSEGFGYANKAGAWVRINQIGGVVIGDNVEIGANTTIDRGAIGDTVIGDGVILDNQIQIAHNVQIGEFTAIAGCVGIAGSTVIGSRCRIGGKTAIVGHIEIADNVVLTATSFVSRSIKEAGVYSSGMPLQKNRDWRKTFARLSRLDELFRKHKGAAD